MLSLSPTVRVVVATEPCDVRSSFDALAGAVRSLDLNPADGHVYLFLDKRRRLSKALWFGESDTRIEVDGNTFAAIIAGIDFAAARRGWFRRQRARGASTAPRET